MRDSPADLGILLPGASLAYVSAANFFQSWQRSRPAGACGKPSVAYPVL
jgi:hypothetical protein